MFSIGTFTHRIELDDLSCIDLARLILPATAIIIVSSNCVIRNFVYASLLLDFKMR